MSFFQSNAALTLTRPPVGTATIPVVLDSPHSGQVYPPDFDAAVDFQRLRTVEDTDVEDLYKLAPSLGATLIAAAFPRSYLDPNRRETDVDTSIIQGRWPHPVVPSPKTRMGAGLIWRVLDEKTPLYARRLSVLEVERRIETCYRPYWAALAAEIAATKAAHGGVVHINCHSMPALAGGLSWVPVGTAMADIVLGDRDGSTCCPELTVMLADAFKAEGLSVAVNDPYKGVELVKHFGRPQDGQHSIQIEINRKLYMHEPTRARTENYAHLQTSLGRVMAKIGGVAKTLSKV